MVAQLASEGGLRLQAPGAAVRGGRQLLYGGMGFESDGDMRKSTGLGIRS